MWAYELMKEKRFRIQVKHSVFSVFILQLESSVIRVNKNGSMLREIREKLVLITESIITLGLL